MAQKARCVWPVITASTAATAAPAERRAASPEAGEITVSPSMDVSPSTGDAR
jgi:hypothetical protein